MFNSQRHGRARRASLGMARLGDIARAASRAATRPSTTSTRSFTALWQHFAFFDKDAAWSLLAGRDSRFVHRRAGYVRGMRMAQSINDGSAPSIELAPTRRPRHRLYVGAFGACIASGSLAMCDVVCVCVCVCQRGCQTSDDNT